MNISYHESQLTKNRETFKTLLDGISEEEYLWKPQPEKWCLLEIVCHLYDEEREDFRQRVKSILENPDKTLPPFDPVLWVTERKYLNQDYTTKLDNFLEERNASIKWLQSLVNPNWDNTYHHPKMGAVTASFFLSNWVAHDYLHLRQILHLKFLYLKSTSGKGLDYAGKW